MTLVSVVYVRFASRIQRHDWGEMGRPSNRRAGPERERPIALRSVERSMKCQQRGADAVRFGAREHAFTTGRTKCAADRRQQGGLTVIGVRDVAGILH